MATWVSPSRSLKMVQTQMLCVAVRLNYMWPFNMDICKGRAAVTLRLLELGADVSARNDRPRTPPQVVLDGVEVSWAALQAERYQMCGCCCSMAQKARSSIPILH